METDTQTCTEERDQDGKVQMFTTAHVQQGFPGGSESKESACTAQDPGSIPGLGRSPGEENGYPLQYSHLENLMDREARWATVMGSQRIVHD